MWAEGEDLPDTWEGIDMYGFSQSFGTTEATVQQCATCHSRREAHFDQSPRPGTLYHDSYNLALLRPGLYHPDGQIQDEVYVYGSFLQSKMYSKGVGCLDCHDAHRAERLVEGNGLCTQCHSPSGNDRFPTLSLSLYDSPEHHFHPEGSEGAQCKSCHMIERTYMGIDGRRDHSFRIPRPDLAAATNSPDACTDCHTGKGANWAADWIERWYPDSENRGPHFATTFAQARSNPRAAAGGLTDIALDEQQSGIVRATALWLLSEQATAEQAEQLSALLSDEDALIRASAAQVQRAVDPQTRVLRLLPLLSDPVRNVRIAVAKELIDAPVARLPAQYDAALQRANQDWQMSLASRLDFPESHLQIAGVALTTRNFALARNAFREVVEMDPQQPDAWGMLIRLAEAFEGPDAARAVQREAISRMQPQGADDGGFSPQGLGEMSFDDLLPPAGNGD
jgi:hypothetical protein